MGFCNLFNLLKLFVKCKNGEIWASGRHHVFVRTGWKPDHVWLRTDDCHSGGGCNQSVDTFGTEITHNGFIIICHVHGSHRRIHWLALKFR